MVERMTPLFFDPDFEPIVTNKTPGPGEDMLLASANNFYKGVSMADLETFDEEYPLTSRLVKVDGRLVEEVYKVGGKYGDEISEIIRHLEAAIPYASDAMAEALRANVAYYKTGSPVDQRALRHRVGRRPGLVGRHHQRVHRGVHGRPRGQGGVGGPGLLRRPREDGGHPHHRRARPVVRGPHAVGPPLPQGGGDRHHRQRHRGRHRDRRRRPPDPHRHQPAQRPGRCASNTAASRSRSRTSSRATTCRSRGATGRSSRGPRRRPSARASGAASRAR